MRYYSNMTFLSALLLRSSRRRYRRRRRPVAGMSMPTNPANYSNSHICILRLGDIDNKQVRL